MTLKEYVIKWENAWRYDYWWRKKHNIPFNSAAHREVTQLDIAFEYFEEEMSNKAFKKLNEEEEIKKGKITRQTKTDESKEDELFNKMKLDSFN